MNSLVISHSRALWTILLPLVVDEVGVGVREEVEVGEVGADRDGDGAEDLAGVRESEHGRIRIRLAGGTTIERGDMIKRWLGLGDHR
jgi:hypothetical protein